jgi:hypothetical protein
MDLLPMTKSLFIFYFVFLGFISKAQNLDGVYVALEFNGLKIDSTGNVHFHMVESFPKEKWFHEMRVTIKGRNVTIEKYPVFFDSLLNKKYSASDGGFLTYSGVLVKSGQVYSTSVNLVECDYIGFSPFVPPIIFKDEEVDSIQMTNDIPQPRNLSMYEPFQPKVGPKIYLTKGTKRKDYIFRTDQKGIWINNVLFYKQ